MLETLDVWRRNTRLYAIGAMVILTLALWSTSFGQRGVALAHILKADNGIYGILHIPPDDKPVAGEPTELDVAFSDDKKAFSLTDCGCVITVKRNNQTIQSAMLRPYSSGATLHSKATVRFPSLGVYGVIVSGSAKDHAFPDFQFDYLVRVATTAGGVAGASSHNDQLVILSLGSLIILSLFAYIGIKAGPHIHAAARPSTQKAKGEK